MANSDWRIESYNGYLNGETFTFEKFVSSSTNDHEHCIFCWKKISDLNNNNYDTEGYYTIYSKTGQTNWICKDCFKDFKDQFNFKLK